MTKTNVRCKIEKNINFVSLWKNFKYYDINRIINVTYNNKKGIDKSMEEKRCLLCDKPYDYKYKMFGRGCLDNIYEELGIHKPLRFVWNKELYLCTKVAWKNHKYFLSKTKKYDLTQKYIALNYLKNMNFDALKDIEEKMLKDIKNITPFSKDTVELMTFTLNDIYKLFNYYQKFEKIIKDFQNINWKEIDEEVANGYIKSLSFIFDITKKNNPISYTVFYSMQYMFWQVVVIGGLFTNKPLSAKLLTNSLSIFGKEPSDLVIEDENIKKTLLESPIFKKKLKQLIEKYGEKKNEFIVDEKSPREDTLIRFDDTDLLYALHDATLLVKGTRNENNKWNLEIEIKDTYDFTDFKDLREYADEEEGKLRDIISTTLNNLGVASSEYGVIKTYNVKIKFETKEGEF